MSENRSTNGAGAGANFEELVRNILTHPNFNDSLNSCFRNQASSGSDPSTTTGPTSSATSSGGGGTTGDRFQHASEELSFLFRRGGSSSQARNPPRFQRGVSHQRPAPYRRPSSAAVRPTARSGRSGEQQRTTASARPRHKFTVKEVVLLRDTDEVNVIRASRRAALMSSGYVVNDVELDKTWSADVVMEFLKGLFDAKFVKDDTPRKLKILMGVGTLLQEPCLQPGQELDGARISRLFSQKILWLMPANGTKLVDNQLPKEVEIPNDFFDSEPDDILMHSPFEMPTNPEPISSGVLSFVEKVGRLMEVVSGKTEEEVAGVLRENDENIQLAASQLLSSNDCKSSEKREGTYNSLSELVNETISKQMLPNEMMLLTVKRDEIWRCALTFYKAAQVDPQRLKKNLSISFDGEPGLDGGALTKEFFYSLFKEVDWRMFEGTKDHRVPRKGCDNIALFKLVGAMLSHSIMQNGPKLLQFPAWLFDVLITGDPSIATELVSIADIPIASANENLIALIQKVDSAENNEQINTTLDNDVYIEIINQSQWPTGRLINMKTKHRFVQQLIMNDVVFQRMPQILALRDGLQSLGVLEMLATYPEYCRQLLIYREDALTPDNFIYNVLTKASQAEPEDPVKKVAHKFFMQYVLTESQDDNEDFPDGRLNALLQFATGQASITELADLKVELDYLRDDEMKVLPEATACAGKLYLPTVHSTYQNFTRNLDTALKYGAHGFGNY
eukprot:gene14536-16039_t